MRNTDEFLDWLCWSWAQDGERFYPPDETAQACMDAVPDDTYNDDEKYEHARGWELGQHSRAVLHAQEYFRHARNRGFDPVERAARYHRDLMQEAERPLDPIDWSWYNE